MPHGDFDFRIAGADERDLRRWRRQGESGGSSSSWWKWAWPPGIVIPVIALFWAVPTLEFEPPPPTVDVGGQTIDGERVLLIQDGSGSMGSFQAVVDQRLAALQAASRYSSLACRTTDAEFSDFVECVVNQTRAAKVDAFYVLADFVWAGVDDSGVARVRNALDIAGTHLFLETVSADPDARLAALAASSGGAVIHTPK